MGKMRKTDDKRAMKTKGHRGGLEPLRGKKIKQLMFAWTDYPLVPCSKMVGGVLTMIPTSNSDNLQFPIVLLHWE